MTSVPAPDRLLADSAWLRRLAQHLTGDAARAADLQQDVTVAALAQPCQAAAGRSWLAAVARNLATSLRRRRAVEQRVMHRLPLRDPVPSPSELAAEAELQQKAVAAVLALPEVYRDTVLLRFMQGLSLHATAEAMGVPEETVRTRQKRALAMLRTQLAPAGRERRGLATLLGGLSAWGVAMKSKHTVAVAVVALFALLVVIPFWPGGESGAPKTDSTATPLQANAMKPVDTAAAGDDPRGVPARTEVPAPDVRGALATASLTMRITWREDGSPAVGVGVQCRSAYKAGTFADTDEHGEATFSGLAPGAYYVLTYDWQTKSANLAAGVHAVVEHALERRRMVAGTVIDQTARPVADAVILVSRGGVIPQWIFTAGRSEANGAFSCRGLGNNDMVGASHPRHGTSEFRMLFSEGRVTVTEVVLQLPATSVTVQGRVVEAAGTPVAGAWVQFGAYDGRSRRDEAGAFWSLALPRVTSSDADGRFTVTSLAEGDCPVLIYRNGLAPFRETVALASGKDNLLVTLQPGGVLTGSVRDEHGNAITRAMVRAEEPHRFPLRKYQESSSDGTFRIEDVGTGELVLKVEAANLTPQRRTFVFAGREAQHWDVVLRVDRAIRGRLVDHRGQALANWFVAVTGLDTMRTLQTDAQGRFVIVECAPVDNTLIARNRHDCPVRMSFLGVRPAEEEQTFTVTNESAPSARIAGQCLNPDGTPLAGSQVQLIQHGWLPVHVDDDRSAADGRFTVGPLPPGRYVLQPHHQQLVFAPVEVELKADETRELGQLRGERPARLTLRLLGDAAACRAAEVRVGRDSGTRDETGVERVFRLFPGRHRVVIRRGDAQQDAFEIELSVGADATREVIIR